MESKVCKKCGEVKNLDQFGKRSKSKDGKHHECLVCSRLYYKENIEDVKIYNYNNLEKKTLYSIQYSKDNRLLLNEKKKLYIKRRNKEQPHIKMRDNVRNLIIKSFKRLLEGKVIKKSSSYAILGCTFEEFKQYIESKFESWMTWENQGKYNGDFNYGWDLDHIIPISSATNEEELIKLNHYTNFQPLCSKVNRDIKRNKLDY